jgi:hypothetical protein
MSALGQTRRFQFSAVTSGLSRTTDISLLARLVRFVPILLQKLAVIDDAAQPFYLG